MTNQRFNLNKSYEKLKHLLDIWTGKVSGWIVDKIEDIHLDIANYDPSAGSSYIPLLLELNNSVKELINLKIKLLNALNGAILDLLILKIKILKE